MYFKEVSSGEKAAYFFAFLPKVYPAMKKAKHSPIKVISILISIPPFCTMHPGDAQGPPCRGANRLPL